jgi:hypothetical protein
VENDMIAQTKLSITRDDQIAGKLIQKIIHDATIVNDASNQFFTLFNDICCKAGLVTKVSIIPSSSFNAKRADIATG